MIETQKELLAAARTVDAQVAENPGLGIPVDPDVAEFMGAFEETALNEGDLDGEPEGNDAG